MKKKLSFFIELKDLCEDESSTVESSTGGGEKELGGR